jgi:hypothetical protein
MTDEVWTDAPVWLLVTGYWDDSGAWVDTAVWGDESLWTIVATGDPTDDL